MYAVMKKKIKLNPIFLLVSMTFIMLLVGFLFMGVGTVYIHPMQVIDVLLGKESEYTFIVEKYRLPRTVIAILAGAGFAISGVLLQGIIRNPLASPDVVGVTKGAGLFAVIIIVLFPQSPVILLPVFAFMGAAVIAFILMWLADKSGAQPSSIALIGLALGAICQALTEYILVKYPLQANDSLIWLSGSIWGKGSDEVYGLLPWMMIFIPVSLLLYKRLDILNLDEETSIGLGLKVKQTRYLLLSVAVALAGSCVAAIGSIGFIGLVAPHIARRIFGNKHMYLLPGSAIMGALILVIADGLGRGLKPPVEIPAGILTAIIGVPYFLYLVHQEKKK